MHVCTRVHTHTASLHNNRFWGVWLVKKRKSFLSPLLYQLTFKMKLPTYPHQTKHSVRTQHTQCSTALQFG